MNNKRFKLLLLIQALCLIVLILVVSGITLYYLDRRDIPHNVNALSERVSELEDRNVNVIETLNSIKSAIDKIESQPKPQNGLNGTHGTNGENGSDSVSTHTIERQTVIEQVPINGIDGLTPDVRCNEDKNRWEIRYNPTESYQVLQGKITKCTISL